MGSYLKNREFIDRLEGIHEQHLEALEEVAEQESEKLSGVADRLERVSEDWSDNFPILERAAGKFAAGQISFGKSIERFGESLLVSVVLLINALAVQALMPLFKKITALSLVRIACDKDPYVTRRYLVSLVSFYVYDREEAWGFVDDLINLKVLRRRRVGKIYTYWFDVESDFVQRLMSALEAMQKSQKRA